MANVDSCELVETELDDLPKIALGVTNSNVGEFSA